jgi:hypothetical protein
LIPSKLLKVVFDFNLRHFDNLSLKWVPPNREVLYPSRWVSTCRTKWLGIANWFIISSWDQMMFGLWLTQSVERLGQQWVLFYLLHCSRKLQSKIAVENQSTIAVENQSTIAFQNSSPKSQSKIALENHSRQSQSKIAGKNRSQKSQSKIAVENRTWKSHSKITLENRSIYMPDKMAQDCELIHNSGIVSPFLNRSHSWHLTIVCSLLSEHIFTNACSFLNFLMFFI